MRRESETQVLDLRAQLQQASEKISAMENAEISLKAQLFLTEEVSGTESSWVFPNLTGSCIEVLSLHASFPTGEADHREGGSGAGGEEERHSGRSPEGTGAAQTGDGKVAIREGSTQSGTAEPSVINLS